MTRSEATSELWWDILELYTRFSAAAAVPVTLLLTAAGILPLLSDNDEGQRKGESTTHQSFIGILVGQTPGSHWAAVVCPHGDVCGAG
jgi:hypothetical protein